MSARDETPHTVLKTLGKKKCNGSWEEATENLTIDEVKSVAETKNCLLYTSPSPRDKRQSRMPSSA